MFMFWSAERFPYVQGAEVLSGPTERGFYRPMGAPKGCAYKPLLLCDKEKAEEILERLKYLSYLHDNALACLEKDKRSWLESLPEELQA